MSQIVPGKNVTNLLEQCVEAEEVVDEQETAQGQFEIPNLQMANEERKT